MPVLKLSDAGEQRGSRLGIPCAPIAKTVTQIRATGEGPRDSMNQCIRQRLLVLLMCR